MVNNVLRHSAGTSRDCKTTNRFALTRQEQHVRVQQPNLPHQRIFWFSTVPARVSTLHCKGRFRHQYLRPGWPDSTTKQILQHASKIIRRWLLCQAMPMQCRNHGFQGFPLRRVGQFEQQVLGFRIPNFRLMQLRMPKLSLILDKSKLGQKVARLLSTEPACNPAFHKIRSNCLNGGELCCKALLMHVNCKRLRN